MTHTGGFGLKTQGIGKAAVSPYNEKIGHFISKDKREKISKEIKEAHFKLGFDCKSALYIKLSI